MHQRRDSGSEGDEYGSSSNAALAASSGGHPTGRDSASASADSDSTSGGENLCRSTSKAALSQQEHQAASSTTHLGLHTAPPAAADRGAQAHEAAARGARQQQRAEAEVKQAHFQAQRAAAVAAAARSALSRVSRNELMVHDMLLSGQEGDLPFMPPLEADDAQPSGGAAPAKMASGRGRGAALSASGPAAPPLPGSSLAALTAPAAEHVEAQQAVVSVVERAFFDALADGLRRGETDRLAALLLDARDQLAALLPPAGGADAGSAQPGRGGVLREELRGLTAELTEKLDAEYVAQRLQRFDAPYCAQAFDLLVHAIALLQAPARRANTQEQYAQVAALFAAANEAAAEGSSEAEVAGAAAGSSSGTAGGQAVEWVLRMVPSPAGDGGLVAALVPVAAAQPAETATTAPPQPRSAVGEASVAAVVAAARFMHRQLSELRADVAAAQLALIKEAILGNGSALEYERQRYARALQAAAEAAAATGGGPGTQAEDMAALVADALPLTQDWLRQVILEAPPQLPTVQQQPGPECSRACVTAGLLLLLQRPKAVSPADCPETLLLDLRAIVALQNELQRLCLLAASLLIVRQILAHKRAVLPAGSPAHERLSQRVTRRMGALLSSGPPMEALVLELHSQVQAALAERTGAAADAGPAAAESEAAASDAAAAPGTEQQQQAQWQQAEQQQEQQLAVELDLVRRMVQQIFDTEHTAYRRVQAGIVAAVTALLRSAAAAAAAGAPGSKGGGGSGSAEGASGGSASWRATLRGIGAGVLAPEVHRLAAALDRIAAVSAAVAHPLAYAPLLGRLLHDEGLQARV